MTGMMDKIKGKLTGGWNGLFASTPAPSAHLELNLRTLYGLFYTSNLVDVGNMTKENILIGAEKINNILTYTLSSFSYDDMQFRMAFYDLTHAIKEWDEQEPLVLDDIVFQKLHTYMSIEPNVAERLRRKLSTRDGIFEWSDKDIYEGIQLAIHFDDKLHSLLQKSGIAAKPSPQANDCVAPFPESPPIYKQWRLGQE